MSTPHPEGIGAALAMTKALALAGINAGQVDYLNLHATATRINDQVESVAVHKVFGGRIPCSGTKGITGHTLGAARCFGNHHHLISFKTTLYAGHCWLAGT